MFLPTLVSLLLISASTAVTARPCVAFDSNWNLLAFNLDGKDWNASAQNTWTGSGQASDITTTGRPSFDSANTTCFLSQYTNSIYVLNGDSSSPSSVYIYDATTQSWSTQTVTTGSFDPSSFDAILDHDTNVFYALSHDNLFSLDMGLLTAANSTALSWVDAEAAPYPSNYQPVMALAQNHIHFLDVPGVPAGSADIFVIHYSYFQPQSQAYPLPNGSAFPATYGQATSFFQPSDVQQEFAFIPQDSSAVYVINVETNTTQVLAGPTYRDPNAMYFASVTALVQLTSNGTVSFLPYQEGNTSVNAAATWTPVSVLASVAPPSTATASSTATGTKGGASSTGTSSSGSNGALSIANIHLGLTLGAALGAMALLL
ncbi:hypothetical protein EDD16DRAFT_413953 [Pisolithus croceorrhizus]|nr:hypothetical protein F5141DRAFT_1007291 [Pisolithus sp. B1]KAI6132378.1 hypothetical protein EV401DRAFT_2253966 [Pisolithus croceorrhizus]KAI6132526.1 hypothetical protein EDD16DRAFT_413953 [Pisolithus croceorrhizus]